MMSTLPLSSNPSFLLFLLACLLQLFSFPSPLILLFLLFSNPPYYILPYFYSPLPRPTLILLFLLLPVPITPLPQYPKYRIIYKLLISVLSLTATPPPPLQLLIASGSSTLSLLLCRTAAMVRTMALDYLSAPGPHERPNRNNKML